jgi:hypothetical protein
MAQPVSYVAPCQASEKSAARRPRAVNRAEIGTDVLVDGVREASAQAGTQGIGVTEFQPVLVHSQAVAFLPRPEEFCRQVEAAFVVQAPETAEMEPLPGSCGQGGTEAPVQDEIKLLFPF